MWRFALKASTVLALGLWLVSAATAQTLPVGDTPVLLTADEMSFDREAGIVIGKGHVEISQGGRVLKSDMVTYNQNTGVVEASGNVSLTEPTGEVIFSNRVELSKDLREGVIDNIRMLFADESRFAANGAVRTGGNRTDMRKAVYSPCRLCDDDPTRAPLWQIKADRIVHDQTKQNVEYTNARMEIFGVPVAYTPFFWHADPTVKRRSGLLPMTFGSDDNLGVTVRTPYFLVISDDWDATFAPIFPTKENPVAAGEIRHRMQNGEIQVSGSITRAAKRNVDGDDLGKDLTRGHIFARGRYDIDDTWRSGFDGALTTDDTYLRRYNISRANTLSAQTARSDVLTSRGFVEGFRSRSYASAEAFHWQGLREQDDQDITPVVAPLLNYNFLSEPLFDNGSRWSFDVNALNLTRLKGADSRRLSMTGGWRMPFTGRLGDLYTVSASVQGDLYWVNEVNRPNRATTFSGVTGRVFPQAVLDWRYPFVRELGNVRHVVEPRAALSIAPNGGNSSRIPNEDSTNFEFDDTNLFSSNRFPGLDRVDGGKRVTYGLRNAFYGDDGGQTEIFIGQSLRFRNDDTFRSGSGIGDDFSDVVGRVSIRPSEFLDLNYRFRMDREEFDIRRNEVRLDVGPPAVRLSVNYLFFDESTNFAEFDSREEVSANATARITENWSVSARTSYNLSKNGGPLQHGGSVTYQDECLLLTVDMARNFTADREFKASTEVFVRVVFKNLGEIGTSN